MIELSVTELFFLTLTFFIVILGTLSAIALVRVLKILKVADDAVSYYWEAKWLVENIAQVPLAILQRVQNAFSRDEDDDSENKKKKYT